MHTGSFLSKFVFQSVGVTLKIRLRSPKSNHFFLLYYKYICASLVECQPSVRERVCTQAFFYKKLSFKVPVTFELRLRSPKYN